MLIAGIDEAGRGPLAGPVYAAAVILDPENPIEGLKDSKKLSQKKRELFFEEIKEKSLAWAIATASVGEIDVLNILQATLLTMQRAVHQLKIPPQMVYVDGNQPPKLDIPVKTIIDGDNLEPCISAASILAKVARDREMIILDHQYPGYGLAKHKGYGTKVHMEALRSLGPTPIHRRSFKPVRDAASVFQS